LSGNWSAADLRGTKSLLAEHRLAKELRRAKLFQPPVQNGGWVEKKVKGELGPEVRYRLIPYVTAIDEFETPDDRPQDLLLQAIDYSTPGTGGHIVNGRLDDGCRRLVPPPAIEDSELSGAAFMPVDRFFAVAQTWQAERRDYETEQWLRLNGGVISEGATAELVQEWLAAGNEPFLCPPFKRTIAYSGALPLPWWLEENSR
jgi:hypothetical protein